MWDSYTEYQQGDVLLGPKARVYIALVIFQLGERAGNFTVVESAAYCLSCSS